MLDLLEIDSVNCIIEADCEKYRDANYKEQTMIEIPVRYYSVKDLYQLNCGSDPFVIPDQGYSDEMGLEIDKAKLNQTDLNFI